MTLGERAKPIGSQPENTSWASKLHALSPHYSSPSSLSPSLSFIHCLSPLITLPLSLTLSLLLSFSLCSVDNLSRPFFSHMLCFIFCSPSSSLSPSSPSSSSSLLNSSNFSHLIPLFVSFRSLSYPQISSCLLNSFLFFLTLLVLSPLPPFFLFSPSSFLRSTPFSLRVLSSLPSISTTYISSSLPSFLHFHQRLPSPSFLLLSSSLHFSLLSFFLLSSSSLLYFFNFSFSAPSP